MVKVKQQIVPSIIDGITMILWVRIDFWHTEEFGKANLLKTSDKVSKLRGSSKKSFNYAALLAVENLVGALDMQSLKTTLLAPHYWRESIGTRHEAPLHGGNRHSVFEFIQQQRTCHPYYNLHIPYWHFCSTALKWSHSQTSLAIGPQAIAPSGIAAPCMRAIW